MPHLRRKLPKRQDDRKPCIEPAVATLARSFKRQTARQANTSHPLDPVVGVTEYWIARSSGR
jgi:hypothetical protein